MKSKKLPFLPFLRPKAGHLNHARYPWWSFRHLQSPTRITGSATFDVPGELFAICNPEPLSPGLQPGVAITAPPPSPTRPFYHQYILLGGIAGLLQFGKGGGGGVV